MKLLIDLHAHSTASDGTLTPSALVARAAERGVDVLALTDHDTLGGLAEANSAAGELGVNLIPGVEMSATWEERTIHILGLRIDAADEALQSRLAAVLSYRDRRAERIAAELEQAGIPGALEGAKNLCRGRLLSRTHFARFLIDGGYAGSMQMAFRKYLTRGNPGYVPSEWMPLEDALNLINAAGGTAVLAHPARYRLTRKQLRRLLQQYVAAGGSGIEVVSGSHSVDEMHTMAAHASDFGLLASSGSDFHGPGQSLREIGAIPSLPRRCRPVWHDWPEAA